MQFVSLPEQFSPNWPSEHWHCPSFPQVPWPLHVVLGFQNAETKKISKSENNETLITYLNNQLRRIDCHIHRYHPLCRLHDHCNWLQLHMQLDEKSKKAVTLNKKLNAVESYFQSYIWSIEQQKNLNLLEQSLP